MLCWVINTFYPADLLDVVPSIPLSLFPVATLGLNCNSWVRDSIPKTHSETHPPTLTVKKKKTEMHTQMGNTRDSLHTQTVHLVQITMGLFARLRLNQAGNYCKTQELIYIQAHQRKGSLHAAASSSHILLNIKYSSVPPGDLRSFCMFFVSRMLPVRWSAVWHTSSTDLMFSAMDQQHIREICSREQEAMMRLDWTEISVFTWWSSDVSLMYNLVALVAPPRLTDKDKTCWCSFSLHVCLAVCKKRQLDIAAKVDKR